MGALEGRDKAEHNGKWCFPACGAESEVSCSKGQAAAACSARLEAMNQSGPITPDADRTNNKRKEDSGGMDKEGSKARKPRGNPGLLGQLTTIVPK